MRPKLENTIGDTHHHTAHELRVLLEQFAAQERKPQQTQQTRQTMSVNGNGEDMSYCSTMGGRYGPDLFLLVVSYNTHHARQIASRHRESERMELPSLAAAL